MSFNTRIVLAVMHDQGNGAADHQEPTRLPENRSISLTA